MHQNEIFGFISLNTIYLNNNKSANFENNLDLADEIAFSKVNIRRIFRKGSMTRKIGLD